MLFSEMNSKQLREARSELQRRLGNTLSPSRIAGLTDNGVSIEGGKLSSRYAHVKTVGVLRVWGRGNRYSGAEVSVAELVEAERIIETFFNEHINGGKVI